MGTETRFVTTVETERALRVGDRGGRSLPAHLTSGGQALLALLPADDVAALYHRSEVDPGRLLRRLATVRAQGYAINRNGTEDGVTAVGMALIGAG